MHPDQPAQPTRRHFYLTFISGLSSLMGLAVAVPAFMYLFLPPRAKKGEQWVDAADLTQIPVGTPQEVSFRVNKVDGWKVSSEKTTAWRLVASKSLIVLNVAAGVGQDKYESNADVNARVNFGPFSGTRPNAVKMPQNLTRTSYFGDVTMNLVLLKIVGEIGMVSGGTVTTYNKFDRPADKSRLYGSVGVTVGFPPI